MKATKALIFLMFLLSGFCGLLYQVVWLRLAFSHFGVITPVLSILVSTFMLGLGVGNYLAGKYFDKLALPPGRLYALIELCLGLSAFLVPLAFGFCERFLLQSGSLDSNAYLIKSSLGLVISILPWCILMGATTPLVMAHLQSIQWGNKKTFSFLYFANVVGATLGVLLTALVIIEFLGFERTLYVGAFINFSIAALAFRYFSGGKSITTESEKAMENMPVDRLVYYMLFMTGFSSMGMEVAWTRAFTPVLRTTIYSFAVLLSAYLIATWVGALLYRRGLKNGKVLSNENLFLICLLSSFLPIIVPDPRLVQGGTGFQVLISVAIVLASIFPFSLTLGYLTPKLLDEASNGSPRIIARLYSFNILGCIIGPLVVGYFLLAHFGTKNTLILLVIPFLAAVFWSSLPMVRKVAFASVSAALMLVSIFHSQSFEDPQLYSRAQVKRDHTATVIAHGEGMKRMLLVNGMGITEITPVTKFMAHFPLAHLSHKPTSALVICFGMGTTFRSLMSWDLPTVKAVELVPSVKEVFSFFHEDANEVLRRKNGEVIIDDGRRYLKRTDEMFDVITLDPPPPVEAAGSSLLYSREFLDLVKKRLKPGGILQHWFPGGDERILVSVASELAKSFPYVRAFRSIDGWGYHFLASLSPIEKIDGPEYWKRLPEKARTDMMEWANGRTFEDYSSDMFTKELNLEEMSKHAKVLPLTDSQPANEYFLIRRLLDKSSGQYVYSR